MQKIEEEIEKIRNQIFHKRFNPNINYSKKGWKQIDLKEIRGKINEKIRELLENNYKVSGGYFATAVKGYHQHYLMYKNRRVK